MERIAYHWKPIEDLPENLLNQRNQELSALAQIWREQARKLKDDASLSEFNARLRRDWAIETGVLEQLYDIDRGVTRILIQQGIHASLIPFDKSNRHAEEIVPILRDHENAIEGQFDFVNNNRKLSASYIKELHQVLTAHQKTVYAVNGSGRPAQIVLLRGDWKKWPNNPERPDGSVHEYCHPEHVASEMDNLIGFHLIHLENNVCPEIEAAWLHHRFTQIHPFMDGNGRVARCLTTLVFLRAGLFPLVIRRDDRARYIQALEDADNGHLENLISLFIDLQKNELINALSLSKEIKKNQADLLEAAAVKLRKKRIEETQQMQKVMTFAKTLQQIVDAELKNVAQQAQEKMKTIEPGFGAFTESSANFPERSHYFRWQIISMAKELNYYADTKTYRAWSRLILEEDKESRFEVLVSFHSLGQEFSGIIACSAMTYNRELKSDEHGFDFVDLQKATDKIFQFTYLEDINSIELQFRHWLERAIIVALDRWQKSL